MSGEPGKEQGFGFRATRLSSQYPVALHPNWLACEQERA